MSAHKELLQEFEGYARSADGVESLMLYIAHRLHEKMARYNWVGFFLADPSQPKTLVLGPYVGSFVPLERISFGVGLCGTAAASRKTVLVNDVTADLRYLNRADLVKSEMVVPMVVRDELVAEIDVESYFAGTFTQQDQQFVEACVALVSRFMVIHGLTAVDIRLPRAVSQ
jgi:putative methionine-R-sulfoxide reductase with GAF domain